MTEQFDVFLAHNSVDKPLVREISARLRERGLNPWLDEEQILAGELFQEEIQKAIPNIKSAAIIIGVEGLGRWQIIELHTLISQFIDQEIKVIPVLLPGVSVFPEKLLFLRQFHGVSFKEITDENAFNQLIRGIKGKKPQLTNSSPSSPAFQSPPLSVPQSPLSFTETLPSNIKLEMVKIPAGSFLMGTEEAEVIRLCKEYETDWCKCEMPQHRVNLQEFYLGKYPVTQEQYQAIMGSNPSYFKDNSKNPVENVSWEDAQAFCQKLNDKTEKKYRLPSEAEWEYACKSGTQTRYYFGDNEKLLGEYVWYDANSGNKTHPVGQKKPNNWGLYDMSGNVWEWCEDGWHKNYENAPKNGSSWNENDYQTSLKLLRGGSWNNNSRYCRSARRNGDYAGSRVSNNGFRLALCSF
jgi:formylglycine-generating enzyme required for sulfatase activity